MASHYEELWAAGHHCTAVGGCTQQRRSCDRAAVWGSPAVDRVDCVGHKPAARSDARRLITAVFFVYAVLGTGIAPVGQLNATWNALGWTTVVTYLILVLGYGYVLFATPE